MLLIQELAAQVFVGLTAKKTLNCRLLRHPAR